MIHEVKKRFKDQVKTLEDRHSTDKKELRTPHHDEIGEIMRGVQRQAIRLSALFNAFHELRGDRRPPHRIAPETVKYYNKLALPVARGFFIQAYKACGVDMTNQKKPWKALKAFERRRRRKAKPEDKTQKQ